MSKQITVVISDSVIYEGGKTGFGGRTQYGCMEFWEYAVRLSSKASSLVEEGDIIQCGTADPATGLPKTVVE